jgi:small subunit ribosomal protein S15
VITEIKNNMSKSAPVGDTTIDKAAIIKEFGLKEGDTGSSEVQIALLTARVKHLTEHLRDNRKDFHSRRGLIAMTARRRKLLDYLKRTEFNRYTAILEKLGLRR